MDDKKQTKVNFIVNKLQELNYYVEQKTNGHIRVNDWDFWCTTEKYYHAKSNTKGQYLNNFIKELDNVHTTEN